MDLVGFFPEVFAMCFLTTILGALWMEFEMKESFAVAFLLSLPFTFVTIVVSCLAPVLARDVCRRSMKRWKKCCCPRGEVVSVQEVAAPPPRRKRRTFRADL